MNKVIIDLFVAGYGATSISRIMQMSRSNVYRILKGDIEIE